MLKSILFPWLSGGSGVRLAKCLKLRGSPNTDQLELWTENLLDALILEDVFVEKLSHISSRGTFLPQPLAIQVMRPVSFATITTGRCHSKV
ncbi:MAG: hypothetical protein M0P11_08755 [Anaerolineaceae bacterium]|nr:hypothetical protein [Anaerolineaceae bacterium]